jgi:hypothetical protein
MKSKKPTSIDDFETGPNIARKLDVDPATIRRYAREGMPHHVLGVGFVRYRLSEILAWLAQRQRKSKNQKLRTSPLKPNPEKGRNRCVPESSTGSFF